MPAAFFFGRRRDYRGVATLELRFRLQMLVEEANHQRPQVAFLGCK